MKEIIKIISIFLFTSFILTSCTSEDNTPTMEEDSYLVLSNVNDQVWTYFSLSTGTIVGTSAFGSTKSDEDKLGCRRHREPRLGVDAHAHVHALV